MTELTTPAVQPTETKKSGFLDKLGDVAAEKILPKLVELLWPRIAALFMDVVLPKIIAVMPLLGAHIVVMLIEHIPGANLVLTVDQIADQLTERMKQGNPEIDIPFVSEAVRDITGFDLSDAIFNKIPGMGR